MAGVNIDDKTVPVKKDTVVVRSEEGQRNVAYWFLIPSFVLMMAFIYFPILFAFVLSFFENPRIRDVADNLFGIFRIDTIWFTGVSEFFDALLVVEGFLQMFHIGALILGTFIGVRIFRRYRPEQSTSVSFLMSLGINLVVSTALLQLALEFLTLPFMFNVLVPLLNYQEVFTSRLLIGNFYRILLNTFLWALICTFFHVVLGIFLAVLLNRDFPLRDFFRTLFILPWAVPSFITALVWKNFVFDPTTGILGREAANAFPQGSQFLITILDTALIIGILVYIGWIFFSGSDTSMMQQLLQYVGLIALVVLTGFVWANNSAYANIPVIGEQVILIDDIKSKFFFSADFYIFSYQTKSIFLAAIITNIWLGVPFMMITFLASLQTIPNDLYEAAKIDGASTFGEFRSITFPNLIPTMRTIALLGIIWTFNLFNVFYILAQNENALGERSQWDIFITYIYYLVRQGPRGGPEWAGGAALSFIVFLILLAFSKAYQNAFRSEADDE